MYNLIKQFRENYFQHVTQLISKLNAQLVILTHILPDRPELLAAMSKIAPIALVIPIPYSIHEDTFIQLKEQYNFISLSLDEMTKPEILYQQFIKKINIDIPTIIIEIGGYFAPIIHKLQELLGDKLLGVIEDTETGHRQYEKLKTIPCPVISVARSLLKESEDALIGSSCLFSTETLIRKSGFILDGKQIVILGFGKIGRGLADALLRRGCKIYIYDQEPSRRILALSKGLQIPEKEKALEEADIIFGATGNYSIQGNDFKHIKKGALLVSCSSKNIEFDLGFLKNNYVCTELFKNYKRYEHTGHYFYLLADGTPINFLDEGVVGPVLALIQAEIILSLKILMDLKGKAGLYEIPLSDKKILSDLWINHFVDLTSGTYLNGQINCDRTNKRICTNSVN